MLKNFTRLLTLFAVFGFISAPHVRAQTDPILVRPTAFYRFEISSTDGGYLLTHVFNEGAANGHTFVPFNQPSFDGMGIYRPPDGYAPDASAGLVPLYRWRVVESGWRVYYYYTTYFAQHGSNYYYEGIAGWVFPPGTTYTDSDALFEKVSLPVYPLAIWYSTDLGFWYGYNTYPGSPVEQPPYRPGKSPFYPQGLIAGLPQTCIDPQFPSSVPTYCGYGKWFYPPPAPTPTPTPTPTTCNVGAGTRSKCTQLGGFWSMESCTCEY